MDEWKGRRVFGVGKLRVHCKYFIGTEQAVMTMNFFVAVCGCYGLF